MSAPEARLGHSAFWPLTFIALSVLTILGYQLWIGLEQMQLLKKQNEGMEQAVVQSEKIQHEVEKLAAGLLTLSATDSDARALIDKYKIARSSQGGAVPSQ
jgi:hypothetical protein